MVTIIHSLSRARSAWNELRDSPRRYRGFRAAFFSILLSAAASGLVACSGNDSAEAPPASEDERIIISGASGQLGTLVVDELIRLGVDPARLILVSRTPEELSAYAQLGASTRFGDFTQSESLAAAYEGGDRMLLISINGGTEDRPGLHNNAIVAAREAGVRHIAYTSSVDVGNMAEGAVSATEHRRTEEYLMESGVAWTMLRHQLYADGLVGQAARMIAEGQAVVQPDEVPTAFVTRLDCARAAAAVLATPGHEGRIYDITGPSAVLRRDIALMASEITERPIDLIDGPGGVPQVSGTMSGFVAFDRTSSDVETLTGSAAMGVRELLAANRDALLGAR